ncbi:hypothetical protein BJ912DRAFT_978903 [Pholiota molesta]|nr:hypothetical protein BJ912DRAFT_978903 [Pholiota molesta]
MIPRPSYMGAGTRNSPIAIDDSEDEVFLELYHNSNKSSPQNLIPPLPEDRSRNMHINPLNATFDTVQGPPESSHTTRVDKKRKRANSFTSQDGPVASSSNGPRGHPTLVNRLAQPESKKARKRRRKAERQALEEARLQNIDWLNNRNVFQAIPHSSVPPTPSWPMETTSHPRGPMSYSSRHIPDIPPSYFGTALPGRRTHSPRNTPPPPPDEYLAAQLDGLSYRYSYENLNDFLSYEEVSHPPPPPPTSSDWVSSMTMAADYPFSQSGYLQKSPQWPPMTRQASLTTQAPLPPVPPPPMPPPASVPPSNSSDGIPVPTSIPKPAVEQHTLPPKPAPSQSVFPIGMKPDQDPNSKHGIFHITASTREAGSDMKKRSPSYIPNPARTLVMEQLPKSHRQPDFINKWSRSACGALPVHIFIDGPNGKALIEFATAEQARKAWASPRLGSPSSGLKKHQAKGRPREDLIKVWWYRVDGVGAGAGVGEIEEGEIEGDASAEKEVEDLPKKETKKERKARLAKEREEKRQRELGTRRVQEQQQQRQPQPQLFNPPEVQMQMANVGVPPLSAQTSTIPPAYPYYANQPAPPRSYSPVRTPPLLPHYPTFLWDLPSSRRSTSNNAHNNKSAFGASLQDSMDDRESIASSASRSGSPGRDLAPSIVASTSGQGTEQYDDEEIVDMEVDTDEVSPVMAVQSQLPATNSAHRSLPARPNAGAAAQSCRPPPAKPPPPPPSATAQIFVPRSMQNTPPASQKPAQLPVDNKPSQAPAPIVQESLSSLSKYPSTSQAMSFTNRSAPSIITPQPKLPSIPPKFASTDSIAPPPSSAATAPPTSASSASSLSSASSSSTPVPSEPKAMKNAPTQPSFTKRALLARQKELEEKIARSKMELAAATAASKSGTPVGSAAPTPQAVKPAMDLGEKQALEDRLRKLVLQSRKPATPAQQQQQRPPPPPINVTPSAPATLSSTNKPAVAPAVVAEKPAPPKLSTVAVSAHSFSLEDMAVSFITQTIETMKSQPASVADAPKPAPAPAPSAPKVVGSHADVRLELAAKQKLLENHISESKMLMSQLTRARTKEERDSLMRTMREKTRCVRLFDYVS